MITQLIYDNIFPTRGRLKRARSFLATQCSKYILKRSDPPITSNVMGATIEMPFSHELPLILRLNPFYAYNLARIGRYTKQKYENLTCIDVGANIGDTIAVLRSEAHFPILCIEGDAAYFSFLERNAARFSEVDTLCAFVGETRQNAQIKVVKKIGTAHIVVSEDDSQSASQIKPLSELLNAKPAYQNAKLLKIDTDGFDSKILRGSENLLQNAKPVLFFEYDPFFLIQQKDDGLSIFDYLCGLGYDRVIVYDNFGEMLLTSRMSSRTLLEELHLYVTGKHGSLYYDMCVFHAEDDDLFAEARASEMNFYKSKKGN